MITRGELREILHVGEGSGVEFKRDDVRKESLAKELVAFANFEGGKVLLGVEDDGSISGVRRDDLEEWVMNICRDKVGPAIIPHWTLVRDMESGKAVAVVGVSRGSSVHGMLHDGGFTYFIRVGSQSREATPEELLRLFQRRGPLRGEMRPVHGAALSDLDHRRLKNYFAHVRRQDVPADGDEAGWNTLLLNTEFMTEHGLTMAAVLLFGKRPNRFLGQVGIQAAAFPGREKDYGARERAQLLDPVVPLLDDRGELIERGLVEQAVDFVSRNTGVAAVLKDDARRVETPDYPPEVIREAIVNAIIHRDYLLENSSIELYIYEDRVEIISPGRLPNGVTLDKMRAGCRVSRNQLVNNVMRDYRYVESVGMGVPRKIVQGMREHNGTEPELDAEREQLVVRLFVSRAAKGVPAAKNEIEGVKEHLAEWQRPQAMHDMVNAAMDGMGMETVLDPDRKDLAFLLESWIASEFGKFKKAGKMRMILNGCLHFELDINGCVDAFEAVEAIDPERNRSREYEGNIRIVGDGGPEEWRDRTDKAPSAIRHAVQRKIKEDRGRDKKTNLIVYLNQGGEYGICRDEAIEGYFPSATRAAKDVFKTVWILWKGKFRRIWPNSHDVKTVGYLAG